MDPATIETTVEPVSASSKVDGTAAQKTDEPPAKKQKSGRPRSNVPFTHRSVNILTVPKRGDRQFAHAAFKKYGTQYVSSSEGRNMHIFSASLQRIGVEGQVVLAEAKNGGITATFVGLRDHMDGIPVESFCVLKDAIEEYSSTTPLPVSFSEDHVVGTNSDMGKTPEKKDTVPRAKNTRTTLKKHANLPSKAAAIAARLKKKDEESDSVDSGSVSSESSVSSDDDIIDSVQDDESV